jgi:Ran GTPase-activating protein (RanGAP) involved in mRNA processing and transport
MEKQVAQQITAEIKKIEREMSAQKKMIKASLGNTIAIEAAEQELKALHTRKDVLTANLKKLELDPA